MSRGVFLTLPSLVSILHANESARRRTGPGDVFGVDETAYPRSTVSLLKCLEHQVSTVKCFGCATRLVLFDVAAFGHCITQDRQDSVGGQKCDWHRSFS